MRITKHTARGILLFILLSCLETWSVYAEDKDVAMLRNGDDDRYREVARAVMSMQGRYRRGFNADDPGNRATLVVTTIKTTPSAPPMNPDLTSSAKPTETKTTKPATTASTTKSTVSTKTTAVASTTKTTAVASTTKTTAVASTTKTIATTTGGSSTVSTEHTSAGHVIRGQFTYISLLITTVTFLIL